MLKCSKFFKINGFIQDEGFILETARKPKINLSPKNWRWIVEVH